MATYISSLNPVPGFPQHSGPYKVGTIDVELATADLESPCRRPDAAADIDTISFRVFYPTGATAVGRHIPWLPKPQRQYLGGYVKFMGFGPKLAGSLSFLPRHVYYATIPAFKNASIDTPGTHNHRWPTVVFSHGLGGSRNAYSHLAGGLASHGVIVVCPEHRDGSAVTTFIRHPSANGENQTFWNRRHGRAVPYEQLSRDPAPETFDARDDQLRVRLWELGLVHVALLAMDTGAVLNNLNTSTKGIEHFAGKMHVHEPGSIIFAGHSFGAATIIQLLKSTFYARSTELEKMNRPLFVPDEDSAICHQVTERSVTILLDIWCTPLGSPNTEPLFNLPLPMYADVPAAAGGTALLAVLSEAFYVWKSHLATTRRLLSPDPSANYPTSDMFDRPGGVRLAEPALFYVDNSAHLSQSDFGVLFPWLTKLVFKAVEPQRVLRLNLRAQLQHLRANNVPVARTGHGDMVDGLEAEEGRVPDGVPSRGPDDGAYQDVAILDASRHRRVEAWNWIDLLDPERIAASSASSNSSPEQNTVKAAVESDKEVMARETEPVRVVAS